jgi:hypothetical protein
MKNGHTSSSGFKYGGLTAILIMELLLFNFFENIVIKILCRPSTKELTHPGIRLSASQLEII